MSAFICSPEHIGTLSAYLFSDPHNRLDLGEITSTLAQANIESIGARYSQSRGKEVHFFYEDIKTNEEFIKLCQNCLTGSFKPIQIIKLAKSFEYQACEYDGWNTSQAKKLINSIIEIATMNLPEYEEAEWTI